MSEPTIKSKVTLELKDKDVYAVIPNCPKCGGEWVFYDGALGYESSACRWCRFDIADVKLAIKPLSLRIGEEDRNSMFWCMACKSYHVDPKDKAHWEALKCFRPWHDWQCSKRKNPDNC